MLVEDPVLVDVVEDEVLGVGVVGRRRPVEPDLGELLSGDRVRFVGALGATVSVAAGVVTVRTLLWTAFPEESFAVTWKVWVDSGARSSRVDEPRPSWFALTGTPSMDSV
ncbi:hypothetical protein ACFQV2_11845 [Actinokineospora soli]|uniref:Uncharacterized protein n=1 Tax=Actinokineospora soli TaxID=1048753 RepID=A0ABW2TK59_9PSEU